MIHHSTVCPGQAFDWTYWRATYRRVFRLHAVVQPFFSTSIGYYVAPDDTTTCAFQQDDGVHPMTLTSAVATEAALGLQIAPLSWLHVVGEAGAELVLAYPYGDLFASLSIRLGLPVF
ncbi:MAG: hypothetical protein U0324_44405 [Polyangiales bacterium]